MPTLKEYLGSIVTSIIDARVMSDLQAVQVAEGYLKNKMLNAFPVPRMRIENVEVTIPVAVEQFEVEWEAVYEPIQNRSFNSLAYRELLNSVGLERLPDQLSRDVRSMIAAETKDLEKRIKIAGNLEPLENYIENITGFLRSKAEKDAGLQKMIAERLSGKRESPKVIQNRIRELLAQEIKVLSEKKILENLNVVIESANLQGHVQQNLMYIKLKVTEEGMEWHRIENVDGEVENRLLGE